MTPVERLQAAIDKLETLKAESFGHGAHAWAVHVDNTPGRPFEAEIRIVAAPEGFYDGVAMVEDKADADLIVTLHRTIDAQIEILRLGIKRQEAVDWTNGLASANRQGGLQIKAASLELALADVILGSDS